MRSIAQAVVFQDLDMVKELVNTGADVNTNDGAAIILASQQENLPILTFLVESGADIHVQDDRPGARLNNL